MSSPTLAVIIGSLRKQSYNRQLAKAVERLAGDRFRYQTLEIGDLPLYNQDFDQDFPAASLRFKNAIEQADGLLFVTPEYNRSIPGVLKNAIDVASRPGGSKTLPASAPASSVSHRVRTARCRRSSTCAMCWRRLTWRCCRSRRSRCSTRKACSTTTATSPMSAHASGCSCSWIVWKPGCADQRGSRALMRRHRL